MNIKEAFESGKLVRRRSWSSLDDFTKPSAINITEEAAVADDWQIAPDNWDKLSSRQKEAILSIKGESFIIPPELYSFELQEAARLHWQHNLKTSLALEMEPPLVSFTYKGEVFSPAVFRALYGISPKTDVRQSKTVDFEEVESFEFYVDRSNCMAEEIIDDVLNKLSKLSGLSYEEKNGKIKFFSSAVQPKDIKENGFTLGEVLNHICENAGIDYQWRNGRLMFIKYNDKVQPLIIENLTFPVQLEFSDAKSAEQPAAEAQHSTVTPHPDILENNYREAISCNRVDDEVGNLVNRFIEKRAENHWSVPSVNFKMKDDLRIFLIDFTVWYAENQ